MKSILISIRPQFVAKILNGEKTIEIRKTCPKCEVPIDVYIYCTKEEKLFDDYPNMSNGRFKHNKVYIGKYDLSGKVVAKFTLNKMEEISWQIGVYELEQQWFSDFLDKCCLCFCELKNYLNKKNGYAWHIDNLEIFDRPKELSEFKHLVKYTCGNCPYITEDEITNKCAFCEELKPLKKAPQSWCYVEGEEDEKEN